MSVFTQVQCLMAKFEMANNIEPNCIVLGFDEHVDFSQGVEVLLGPLKSDPDIRGTGNFFRGCRVLETDSPGVWVGRMIFPL